MGGHAQLAFTLFNEWHDFQQEGRYHWCLLGSGDSSSVYVKIFKKHSLHYDVGKFTNCGALKSFVAR